MTSNDQRDFPAALLRRCLHLNLGRPGPQRLAAMVAAHLGPDLTDEHVDMIDRFLSQAPGEFRAADQLLNAVYLTQVSDGGDPEDRGRLAELLMRPLGPGQR
ncbi:MoxR family ATPase, partial [Streptomyces sp. PKU-EA00015]|nr:MoxR family ATPase [Streptomyces sp. PKU-EA00015]